MNLRRISAVAIKETKEVLRDRMFLGLAFLVPAMLMVVFGYGLTLDVENLSLAVIDYDNSFASRDYLDRFIHSRYFDFKGYLSSEKEIPPLVADNRLRIVIIIPEHFQKRLSRGRPSHVQIIIDGTFPFRAQTAKSYVIAINDAVSRQWLTNYLSNKMGINKKEAERRIEPVRLNVRYLYNQEIRSIWSMAPSLMMFVLMVIPPLLTALGIVREKESGSIYNIYTSTVTKGEFLIGKLTPYGFISILNTILLWLMATRLFGAPFKGSLFFFFPVTILYVLCTTGLGLLISLLVSTQIAALIVTVIVTILPAILYSGMFVPVSSLGDAVWVEAHLFPSMYFNTIAHGVFLKGVGLKVLWPEVTALAIYACLLFFTGYFLFRKRTKS